MDNGITLIFGVCMALWLWSKIAQRRAKNRRIHEQIEQAERNAHIPRELAEEVRQMAWEGRSLEAMRKLRVEFGMSVIEAKIYVDGLPKK